MLIFSKILSCLTVCESFKFSWYLLVFHIPNNKASTCRTDKNDFFEKQQQQQQQVQCTNGPQVLRLTSQTSQK